MSRLLVLEAKTLIASSSARSVSIPLISRSTEGNISLLYASSIVTSISSVKIDLMLLIYYPAMSLLIASSSVTSFAVMNFSFSALLIARIL